MAAMFQVQIAYTNDTKEPYIYEYFVNACSLEQAVEAIKKKRHWETRQFIVHKSYCFDTCEAVFSGMAPKG